MRSVNASTGEFAPHPCALSPLVATPDTKIAGQVPKDKEAEASAATVASAALTK